MGDGEIVDGGIAKQLIQQIKLRDSRMLKWHGVMSSSVYVWNFP